MADLLAGRAPADALPFDFQRDGAAGTLYYGAVLRSVPAEPPAQSLERGLFVQRWLEPWEGGGQLKAVQAPERCVRLRVRVSTPQQRNFVAVEVPLPVGARGRRHHARLEQPASPGRPGRVTTASRTRIAARPSGSGPSGPPSTTSSSATTGSCSSPTGCRPACTTYSLRGPGHHARASSCWRRRAARRCTPRRSSAAPTAGPSRSRCRTPRDADGAGRRLAPGSAVGGRRGAGRGRRGGGLRALAPARRAAGAPPGHRRPLHRIATGRCCGRCPPALDDRGIPLPVEAPIPPRVASAFLAAEDRRFGHHPGVDPLALARAVAQNLRAGRVVSGASTIPQQLARLLVPRPRTLPGKVQEALWAIRLTAAPPRRGAAARVPGPGGAGPRPARRRGGLARLLRPPRRGALRRAGGAAGRPGAGPGLGRPMARHRRWPGPGSGWCSTGWCGPAGSAALRLARPARPRSTCPGPSAPSAPRTS